MRSNWAFTLHVKHPKLYLPVLESQRKRAFDEVAGLCRLLKRFNTLPNSKILDYSCGIGRHSILFAKKGYSVVGYDPSSYYLKIANDMASKSIHDPKM